MPKTPEVCDPIVERRQPTCEFTVLFFRFSLLAVSGGVLVAGVMLWVFPMCFAAPCCVGVALTLGSSAGILAAGFLNDQQLTSIVGGGLEWAIENLLSQLVSSLF